MKEKVPKILVGMMLGGLVGVVVGLGAGFLSLMCFMDGLIMGGRRVSGGEQIRFVTIVVTIVGTLIGAVLMLFIPEAKAHR